METCRLGVETVGFGIRRWRRVGLGVETGGLGIRGWRQGRFRSGDGWV